MGPQQQHSSRTRKYLMVPRLSRRWPMVIHSTAHGLSTARNRYVKRSTALDNQFGFTQRHHRILQASTIDYGRFEKYADRRETAYNSKFFQV
jgi:hypothetical protein